MPGTLIDDLEIIEGGHGGGIDVPDGGDNDGEPSGGGRRRRVPNRAYFTALQLGLAAIVMFFMALASSYIVRKGLGTDWQRVQLPRILWFNTAVLLFSSGTIIFARRKLAQGDHEAFRTWWWVTTGLGLIFLAGQVVAWKQLAATGMLLATNPSSSFFYLLTGAHGAHLVGGILALLYVAFRAWKRSNISQATAAELASIYWHFMDGLWIFLFALITVGR